MHEIGIEWMTQTEVNGHFLELRGIPDEKLKWERIPEAIAGANYYNIQNIPGQLTVEPDSGKIYLKIQYVTGADIRETTIMDALGRYLEEEMAKICQWVTFLNQTEKVIGSQWLPQAAGKIHTDFERGFIRAEVVNYKDLLECGSLAAAREKGLVGLEGKDYVMQDGDVVEFRFNV